MPYRPGYDGYLRAWVKDINRLWDQGHTTGEIAVIIGKDIKRHPEKLQDYYGGPWPSSWRIPDPSTTIIRYVLIRTHPNAFEPNRAPKAGSYPTQRNWLPLLHPALAQAQARWERVRTIHDMIDAGLSPNQIGSRYGITGSRVRQLLMRRPAARSPLEHYLANDALDLQTLAHEPNLRRWATGQRSELNIYIEAQVPLGAE